MSCEELLNNYFLNPGVWDEMSNADGVIRAQYGKVAEALQQFDVSTLQQKDRIASELFMNQGITFTVYSDNAGI